MVCLKALPAFYLAQDATVVRVGQLLKPATPKSQRNNGMKDYLLLVRWSGVIRKRGRLCSMLSFRDPGSFHLVPLSSSASSGSVLAPCIFHVWQQTGREREWSVT